MEVHPYYVCTLQGCGTRLDFVVDSHWTPTPAVLVPKGRQPEMEAPSWSVLLPLLIDVASNELPRRYGEADLGGRWALPNTFS